MWIAASLLLWLGGKVWTERWKETWPWKSHQGWGLGPGGAASTSPLCWTGVAPAQSPSCHGHLPWQSWKRGGCGCLKCPLVACFHNEVGSPWLPGWHKMAWKGAKETFPPPPRFGSHNFSGKSCAGPRRLTAGPRDCRDLGVLPLAGRGFRNSALDAVPSPEPRKAGKCCRAFPAPPKSGDLKMPARGS